MKKLVLVIMLLLSVLSIAATNKTVSKAIDEYFTNVWVEGNLRGDMGVLSVDSAIDMNDQVLYDVREAHINNGWSGKCQSGLIVKDGVVVGCDNPILSKKPAFFMKYDD